MFFRYLTGNPCTEYEGYREYVIATLDNLKWLDGKEIEKSERILAKQDYENLRNKIISQQSDYAKKREREKQDAAKTKVAEEELQLGCENQNESVSASSKENQRKTEKEEEEEEEEEKRYWQEKTDFTPESRIELHQHIEEKRKQREKIDDERIGKNKPAKETRFFASDGHVLNINQGKWDFKFDEDEDNNRFVLDLPCFKHLDTSLIDVDVQPTYVRVTVKGKVFQLALSDEVNPDSSSAKRSQTTGHLIISMPKVRQVVKPLNKTLLTKNDTSPSRQKQDAQLSSELSKHSRTHHERLEIEPKINSDMDFSKIANNGKNKTKQRESGRVNSIPESREESFVDDPDVPPLV